MAKRNWFEGIEDRVPATKFELNFPSFKDDIDLAKALSKTLLKEPFDLENVNPSTPLSDRKITGYFPIYSLHNSVLFEIYKPSNNELSVPISKNLWSILIFKDFPNRLGLVNKFTFPQLFKSISINPVLST